MLAADGAPIPLGAMGLGGTHPEAVTLANGDIVVAWTNTVSEVFPGPGTDTSATAVVAGILAPDGTPRGPVFQVNTTEYLYQQDVEVVVLAGGGFVIAWTDLPFGATYSDARAQVFAADGTPVGSEILLAQTTDGHQEMPQIAAMPGGGFMAVWNDSRAESYGRYFDADGTPASDEFYVGNFFGERLDSLVVLDDGSIRYVGGGDLWTSDGTILPGATDVLSASSSSTNDTYYAQQFETAMAQTGASTYVIAGVVASGSSYEVVAVVRDAANYDNVIYPTGQSYGQIAISQQTFSIDAQNLVNIDVTGLASGGFVAVWAYYTGDGTTATLEIHARAFGADLTPLSDETTVYSGSSGQQGQPFVTETADGRVFIGWTDNSGTIGTVASEIVGQFLTLDHGGSGSTTPTTGADVLTGTETSDVIAALAGNDSVDGLGGNDRILGGDDNDTLNGDAGRDRLVGDAGNDSMSGGTEQDTLLGSAGNDTMNGDGGDDVLRGNGDHDLEHGGAGNDIVIGGTGRDTLFGDGDDDILRGNGGFDTVDGGNGNDFVAGGAQADLVLGGAGNDTVQGGGGFDTIDGGTGDDELTGNFNADQFIFADGHGNDTITDFEATNNAERIDLSGVSAINLIAELGLGSATSGAATQVGADVVIDTGGGDSITLLNVSLSGLDVNDFTF